MTTKEIVKKLIKEKKQIQSKKGPFGYTKQQAFQLIQINDKIKEYKSLESK